MLSLIQITKASDFVARGSWPREDGLRNHEDGPTSLPTGEARQPIRHGFELKIRFTLEGRSCGHS